MIVSALTWRDAVAAPLALVGLFGLAINYSIIWYNVRAPREQRKFVSFLPLVSGPFLSAGMLISGRPYMPALCWIPLVIDPGGFVLLAISMIQMWSRRK